jgi:hypothetical protein
MYHRGRRQPNSENLQTIRDSYTYTRCGRKELDFHQAEYDTR